MSKKEYWEKFYKKHNSEVFEWLIDFKDLIAENHTSQIKFTIYKTDPTLLLDAGCGTSLFGYNLAKSTQSPGFLINADFSHQALSILKAKYASLTKKNDTSPASFIDYVQCDCKHLPLRPDVIDLIIDKGYLDSVLKSSNVKDAVSNALLSMGNLIEKMDAKAGAVMIQITDESPELRINLFDNFDQRKLKFSHTFKEIDLGEQQIYFCYFIHKKIN
jgi:SAM-dependent methyltransferase